MAEKMVGNAPEAIRQARLKTMREKIHFLRESDGFEVFIPRFRLKKEHVNKLFGDEVEHVHDLEGNVILPDDYMWHCLPPPLKYFVYHRERVPLPPDDAHDPWYIGETQVVVTRAPADIPAHALVAWIRKGVERGDERYMQAKNAVNELHEQLKRNKERQDNVPFMKTNAESEQGMAGERLYVTKELKKKRAELQDQLKKAQTRLDRENARRRMHEVTVECIRVDDKRKVTDWMAYFGTRREENAAIDMDQWPSVRVFHKMEKGGSPTAYWDDELEATDEILQDPDLEINMRGVQLRRIKHGLGAFTDWQRGDAYKGRFVEGKRHGQGVLYDRVGVYRGEFEDDVRHGKGIQVFANGDVYEGPFEFDKMHGPDGVLKFADGSVYEGDFAIGTPTGQGTYSSHGSCERIAGDFSEGVLHGIGLHTKPTGERCEGDFVLGDLHGRGSWRSRKGDTCDGDFENGEPHGYARYTFRKGPMYDGFFRDGLRDGPGSMVYGNVSAVFDRSTGKHGLRHDFKYEGTWLAGRIQARNTHVTVHDRFLPTEKETPQPGYVYEQLDTLGFTTNSRSWTRYPFLHALVLKEDSKREKRFLRSRALARREKKSLRQLRKRNLASFKQKRRDTIALFKRIDRALQSIHNEAEEAAQARREAAAKAGPGQASEPQKNEGTDDDGPGGGVMGGSKKKSDEDNANPQEYDEASEYGGNGRGSGNGERSTSRNSNSNDHSETSSVDHEDASYESGSSGDDDDDDEDEDDDEDDDDEEDGDEWGYYDDSDWYSNEEEEEEDNEGLRTRAQNAASSLPKSMSSNPVYHDLRLSLVDIFEDPPPTDSKAGIISLRAALEYYAQREHKRKLEDLLRKRKSGSGG